MNLFSAKLLTWGADFFSNIGSSGGIEYGVYDPGVSMAKAMGENNSSNMATFYMCNDILSRTIGMIPMDVVREGRPDKEHRLYYNLRYKMSELMNNQVMMSTIEHQRNTYGNSFVDTRGDYFELIPIEIIDDWNWKGKDSTLQYHLAWSKCNDKDRRNATKNDEWVSSKKILHFRGLSIDGIMGLPKFTAAIKHSQILGQATDTIISFYQNRAMSPMALESKLDTAAAFKLFQDGAKGFSAKYAGAKKAGIPIEVPPNAKLTPLQLQFADAELVSTMKFTRDEICNMFGIPSFLYNSSDTVQMDIEQQSRNFTMFTIAPILASYAAEFRDKLLSKREVLKGLDIKFDTSVIIESDLVSMANAYGKFIQNGLISPNEASERLGFDKSDAVAADDRFVQQQLIALSTYFEMHPAMKDANKNTQSNNNNKNEGDTNTK